MAPLDGVGTFCEGVDRGPSSHPECPLLQGTQTGQNLKGARTSGGTQGSMGKATAGRAGKGGIEEAVGFGAWAELARVANGPHRGGRGGPQLAVAGTPICAVGGARSSRGGKWTEGKVDM